ncbi:MAG: TPM domain-containing protein [Xanthomonadales bacterium]|nr:TPM domain-containing protein [Xanthomonadales bacterium]
MRWLRHLFDFGRVQRAFPIATLDAIQHAVAASEHAHRGEICFAVEGGLPLAALQRAITPRERAEEVFARLRVWDTRENTGVLVYVQLADHAIEIVADRGIAAHIDAGEWQRVCATMKDRFTAGEYEAGAVAAVAAIGALLEAHFPAAPGDNPDERPNRPVIL